MYNLIKSIQLLVLLSIACLLLTACSDDVPRDETLQRKIANHLTKETTGKLFDVESVTIKNKKPQSDGSYLIHARYTLKYTSSIHDYTKYMLDHTNLDNRIDAPQVKNEIQNKLIEKYGRPIVGQTRSFQDQFTFKKEAFGWEVQVIQDWSKVEGLIP